MIVGGGQEREAGQAQRAHGHNGQKKGEESDNGFHRASPCSMGYFNYTIHFYLCQQKWGDL